MSRAPFGHGVEAGGWFVQTALVAVPSAEAGAIISPRAVRYDRSSPPRFLDRIRRHEIPRAWAAHIGPAMKRPMSITRTPSAPYGSPLSRPPALIVREVHGQRYPIKRIPQMAHALRHSMTYQFPVVRHPPMSHRPLRSPSRCHELNPSTDACGAASGTRRVRGGCGATGVVAHRCRGTVPSLRGTILSSRQLPNPALARASTPIRDPCFMAESPNALISPAGHRRVNGVALAAGSNLCSPATS